VTILRVGSTQKYADGWDVIFGKNKAAKKSAASASASTDKSKKSAAKKSKKS
jgi:hypothetical protein